MRQYIYGKNTVVEALKSGGVTKVFLANNDETIIKLCQQNKIKVEPITKDGAFKMVGKVNHQGVIAQGKEYSLSSVEEIVAIGKKKQYPLIVLLDGLEDPHNLGAILRSCDALNVDGVIIGKNRSVGLNATVAKVSTGAIDHVKVAAVTNLSRTLEDLKKLGYWVVGLDLHDSVDYRKVDYNMPCVLVVGSEGKGISRLVKKSCDHSVVLPMIGHVNSLNASVATAVMLYQVHNSRNPI